MARAPEKAANDKYRVHFHITNKLDEPLNLLRFESGIANHCKYLGGDVVPADGETHELVLDDPSPHFGADGKLAFVAHIDGEFREYVWSGACPIGRSNTARGPGITDWNKHHTPLVVNITVDRKTKGWTKGKLVKHVFVLMMENRSFDHMLGFSGISGTDPETGKQTEINGLNGEEKNSYEGKSYTVEKGADECMKVDPGHEFTDVVEQLCGDQATYPPGGPYPKIKNTGFVSNFARTADQAAGPGDIMKCYTPKDVPVLDRLAREFAVCDSWWSSLPGATWPNRFFMMAGSSGGMDRHPKTEWITKWSTFQGFAFENGTLIDAVRKGKKKFRLYADNTRQAGGNLAVCLALKGVTAFDQWRFSRLESDLNRGDYDADLTLIEPNYGRFWSDFANGSSQHPLDSVTAGEHLIKQTYEMLRKSPIWYNSLLIVTWDEHGGFYDHAAPGRAVKPGDKPQQDGVNAFGFVFDRYGVRVPALVISPWIARNVIDHRPYDHTSIPATVIRNFGLKHLTKRDANAKDVLALLTLRNPRHDAPRELPCNDLPAILDQAEPLPSDTPLEDGNLAGWLLIAAKVDRELSAANQEAMIASRVQSITTRGQAGDYIQEVAKKLDAATKSN